MLANDKRGLWRWLALAALIVQLVVASGHFHFGHENHAADTASVCSLADAGHCPPLDHQHDHEDGECEICKTLRATHAAVLAAALALAQRIEFDDAPALRRSIIAAAALSAHAFQARGPPAALNAHTPA